MHATIGLPGACALGYAEQATEYRTVHDVEEFKSGCERRDLYEMHVDVNNMSRYDLIDKREVYRKCGKGQREADTRYEIPVC